MNEAAQSQIELIKNISIAIKPVVVIQCITYNHEPYVREALDGFVMQKTNFPFVAVVHDDASTDGTSEILREYAEKYPDMIIPIYEKENQYSKGNGKLRNIVWSACLATGAKYIAFCEGDDYWIDPLKLQKQVDYLEEHPDCSLVCSNYNQLFQKSQRILLNNQKENAIIKFNDLILHNFISTLTIVVRASIIRDYLEFSKDAPYWTFGDYPIWLFASTKGYIMRMKEETAIYRVLEKSASHMSDDNARLKWAHSELSMFDYFDSRFSIPKNLRRESLFIRCHKLTKLAIQTNDIYLRNRIKDFYLSNRFYIAWISFCLVSKYPRLKPIFNFVDSHLCIKSPMFYIKSRFTKRIN